MNQTMNSLSKEKADYYLDITGEICPITFVKTKLLLERMKAGETAEVRLKGAEPLNNVPRSVADHGDEVLSLAPEDANAPADGVHVLRILKK